MSKWRPSDSCVYVFPDIHGAVDLLEMCLVRILPLRNKNGKKDRIIFLGDYIDRHQDSHAVIDILIELKKTYPDQVVCLKGNHEHMLLMGLEKYPNYLPVEYKNQWEMWLYNGGKDTLLGYIKDAQERRSLNKDIMVSGLTPGLIKKYEIIPEYHLEFMMSCLDYYELDNFLFVHGGGNPKLPWSMHPPEILYWDRKLFQFVKKSIANNSPLPWSNVIISGHNGPDPIFHDNYNMIDAGSPKKLLVFEANSREAFVADSRNNKLVKFPVVNSIMKRSSFRRNS